MKVHQGIFISEWLLSFGFDKTRMFFWTKRVVKLIFCYDPNNMGIVMNCAIYFPVYFHMLCDAGVPFFVSSKLLQKKGSSSNGLSEVNEGTYTQEIGREVSR